ncbi:MAG TPA: class I SAM-dependent methyltransferase [Steroidobacteraceae bacterium]|nr:class I SAM-dependent methyltransferase [Steroidobacteraceae bacterium]
MTRRETSPRSFRDPDAVLVEHEGRLIRAVRAHALESFRRTLENPVVRRWMADGGIVKTWPLSRAERPRRFADFDGECFEHERIPFVSHPSEWAPEMLAAAGEATLALARALLPRGLQLKDATPANILFRGPEPVFVDLPSIIVREPGDCLWVARHQFETTFLLPLIASVEAGLPLAWTLANPVAGLAHETLARILGARRWLRPRLWRSVALPVAFAARQAAKGGAPAVMTVANDARAQYVLERAYAALGRQLRRCTDALAARGSHWQAYTATRGHYGDADLAAKRTFVSSVVADTHPERTLDIGANTGEFSEIATAQGEVVALDIDERSVAKIARRAREKKLAILPLVGNFGRPTPATGWRNREADSFLERAAGRFDLVLMLAVVHHLRVTEGVPVAQQLEAVAGITRRDLVVEFVPATDPMFAAIARGREPLYPDCLRPAFELELTRHFTIERTLELPNGRVLYFARLSSLPR